MRSTSSTSTRNSVCRAEARRDTGKRSNGMTRSTHGLIGRLFTAGVAAAAMLASGFANGATELTVWHAYRGDEKTAFEKVVAMYNAKQKDVVVRTLAVPYDAYADKISASVPRG